MILQFFYDFLIHIFNLFNEDTTKQCHNSTPYCISYFNTIVTNYNSHANYKRLANTVCIKELHSYTGIWQKHMGFSLKHLNCWAIIAPLLMSECHRYPREVSAAISDGLAIAIDELLAPLLLSESHRYCWDHRRNCWDYRSVYWVIIVDISEEFVPQLVRD